MQAIYRRYIGAIHDNDVIGDPPPLCFYIAFRLRDLELNAVERLCLCRDRAENLLNTERPLSKNYKRSQINSYPFMNKKMLSIQYLFSNYNLKLIFNIEIWNESRHERYKFLDHY